MKRAIVLIWLILPAPVHGQSTLNFPRAFSPAELGMTGFAVVNPSISSAQATFTLRNSGGVTLDTHIEAIPAGGQFAVLGSQLFSSVPESGWVQVTSPSSGLTGFYLSGDFASFTDGADPTPTSSDLLLPIVAPDMEINVANASTTPATVTLSLAGADGALLSSSSAAIAATGVFQAQASSVFPGADLNLATHVLVTGGFSISAAAVVTDFLVAPSLGVMNGIPTSANTTQLNFGHVISGAGGGGNWLTAVGVTNLTSSTNTVSIAFTPCPATGGPCPGTPTTVQRSIAANGALRESAESLFGFSSGTYQDGWIRMAGTAAITGFVAYADTVAGGMAIVPVQAAAMTEMIFGHVAQATGWLTGVALLNTTTATANVEIYAMNPDGSLIGGAQDSPAAAFTLFPGAKVANLINSPWIPNASTNGGFVYVRTTNGVPLYGIELFFLSNLALLSNVAPGPVAAGITYTPPPPGGSLALNSISPGTLARGDTLTLTGSGFASGNVVVFDAALGGVDAAASLVSSTTLSAVVPPTAISGPVFVRSGSVSTSPQIVQVTQSPTTLIETPVVVGQGQAVTDADIYVPVPAATLNITDIGAGDRFLGISAATSSVELAPGQTTDLLIFGTGVSEANGSTPSISGTGVTFSNVAFSQSSMFVEVTVSPSAPPGPRTFTITNSNLDTSVLSGGIIILN